MLDIQLVNHNFFTYSPVLKIHVKNWAEVYSLLYLLFALLSASLERQIITGVCVIQNLTPILTQIFTLVTELPSFFRLAILNLKKSNDFVMAYLRKNGEKKSYV